MARRVEPEPASTETPAATEIATAAEAVAAEELPILLVDDREENLRALEAVLAPLGYSLLTARSGGEALRLLLDRDVALILLDVRMPGLDGLETARLIKGRARSAEVPIVFLTAARDEVENIIRGYGIGAVDYVLKPFEPELLRSKVAVFAELETSRRALKRSEALLRGAFEAAPIGKTLLDSSGWRVIRSNPAFARLVGWSPEELQGTPIIDLCQSEDVELLSATLERVAAEEEDATEPQQAEVDLRVRRRLGSELWVGIVATRIELGELEEPLLMVQWVDLTTRRRAERARAELLLEQAARAQAETTSERLRRLQQLTAALESLALEELLAELTVRLAEMLGARAVEAQVGEELVLRTAGALARRAEPGEPPPAGGVWEEVPLQIEGTRIGAVRVAPAGPDSLEHEELSFLREAADRAALSIRRAQLHEEEHRIAVELQRGLIPRQLAAVTGLSLAAHYEAAGVGAEVGGDWYDAFELPGGRLGVVLGDVAGSGIRAASTMGQLRSVTRAFALAEGGRRQPGEVMELLNGYRVALEELGLFTVVYAIIDPAEGRFEWSNAGHPPPLHMSDGDAHFLDAGDGLMGLEDAEYRTLSVPISSGDALVLYSDGLIERRSESLDAGMARLATAALSGPPGAEELCQHLLARLLPVEGGLNDDVTAVVVKVM